MWQSSGSLQAWGWYGVSGQAAFERLAQMAGWVDCGAPADDQLLIVHRALAAKLTILLDDRELHVVGQHRCCLAHLPCLRSRLV